MMEGVVHNILVLFTLLLQLIIAYGAEIYIATPETRDYTFVSNYGIRASDRILSFQLNACNNAYIGLMSGSSDDQPLYEIDLGAYGNTVSYIRAGKSVSLPRLDEYPGPALKCNTYKDFRITWDDDTINVSRGLDDSASPFLTWTSPTTFWPVQTIGICTAHGATGEWIFHIQENSETTSLSYTELSTSSSLGTTMPPTTTDGIASLSQSPKTNDVPSTHGSATITEHHLSVSTVFPVTSTVSSPSNRKTTETPDFTTTSELTPCAPSCTKAYTCHCPTIPNTPAGSNTLAQLTLDKKTLSSYERRHQSASDPRKSSVYIGCVGITVLVLSVAFIVILDFLPSA